MPKPQRDPKLKRENKHRPAVLSSKRAVPTLRVAPGLSGGSGTPSSRDPRFDAVSAGSFSDAKFRQQYAHVFEKQREELSELKTALSGSKAAEKAARSGSLKKKRRMRSQLLSPEAVAQVKLEVNRRSNQLKMHEQVVAKQKLKAEARKKEVAQIGEGKRPFFKKKGELRKEELVAKYEELKKSGGLDKFMAKKRKKTASKQRRLLPSDRSGGGYDGENE